MVIADSRQYNSSVTSQRHLNYILLMGDTCDVTAMVLYYTLVHCTYNHMPTIPLAPSTLAQVVSPYHSSR